MHLICDMFQDKKGLGEVKSTNELARLRVCECSLLINHLTQFHLTQLLSHSRPLPLVSISHCQPANTPSTPSLLNSSSLSLHFSFIAWLVFHCFVRFQVYFSSILENVDCTIKYAMSMWHVYLVCSMYT